MLTFLIIALCIACSVLCFLLGVFFHDLKTYKIRLKEIYLKLESIEIMLCESIKAHDFRFNMIDHNIHESCFDIMSELILLSDSMFDKK